MFKLWCNKHIKKFVRPADSVCSSVEKNGGNRRWFESSKIEGFFLFSLQKALDLQSVMASIQIKLALTALHITLIKSFVSIITKTLFLCKKEITNEIVLRHMWDNHNESRKFVNEYGSGSLNFMCVCLMNECLFKFPCVSKMCFCNL